MRSVHGVQTLHGIEENVELHTKSSGAADHVLDDLTLGQWDRISLESAHAHEPNVRPCRAPRRHVAGARRPRQRIQDNA